MTNNSLEELIERSCELHERAHTVVSALEPFPELKFELAQNCGHLSIEHATGFLLLVGQGFQAPAFALLRPQFEALVRGFWLAYAAKDPWVQNLAQPLTLATAKRADDSPMLAKMVQELEESTVAPRQMIEQLKEYKDLTGKALNSFNHGGIHQLVKFVSGYPPQLTYDSLRNSNAMLTIALQLVIAMSGRQDCMGEVRRLIADFPDCLPVLKIHLGHA